VCASASAPDVADRPAGDHGDVVRPLLVQARGPATGGVDVGDRRQRLVLDGHGVQSIGHPVRIVGDDDRDRLAHVAHAVRRQDRLDERPGLLGLAVGRGDGRADLGEIRGSECGQHAGEGERLGDVDLQEARPRVDAPNDPEVHGARAGEVIEKAAGADEQRPIFLAPRRGADQFRWNG